MRNRNIIFTITFLAFGWIALLPVMQAVIPPPDGGYPGGNTAEGASALASVSAGTFNTAVGFLSLSSNTDGQFNTAIGAGTLLSNTADQNTATGAGALLSNTTGFKNTANGVFALFKNTTGFSNTATGESALLNNTQGTQNTAFGAEALFNNTFGVVNTAVGFDALFFNTEGNNNTAVGEEALESNTGGNHNTAMGSSALRSNTTGNENIALGSFAGVNLSNGDRNIDIGNQGQSGDDHTMRIGSDQSKTFIAGIFGAFSGFNTVPVMIDAAGQLQSINSSRRFKRDIQPMDKASETILALKPVAFHYNADQTNRPQFGLIAEEVAEVNPDLVVYDKDGKIYTVRYDAVNAMLLNEFLKEHKKVEEQQAAITELKSTVARQQKGMETLTARFKEQAAEIQKVSPQFQISKASRRTAEPIRGRRSASQVAFQSVNTLGKTAHENMH